MGVGIQAGGQVVMLNTYPPPIRIHVLKMFVLFEKGLKVFISVYFGSAGLMKILQKVKKSGGLKKSHDKQQPFYFHYHNACDH